MLVGDSRTSSANGAFGRHDRQDNAGMRLVTAASHHGGDGANNRQKVGEHFH
jgi:hypothetical protein